MEVIYFSGELINHIQEAKIRKFSIGFVPTMGALHQGHISLVKQSVDENDITIVSIFVNPTQFNDKSDLARYPRTLEHDLKLLEPTGCTYVFIPEENDIYPEPDTRIFDFGTLDKVMEGKFRKGHFNGVAQVVSRLVSIVSCNNAYFGQKDFQQLAIIKNMTSQLQIPVRIVPCPIVREPDGLAMSSRNMLLTHEHRMIAPFIFETLEEAKTRANKMTVTEVKEWVTGAIQSQPLLNLEYFEIVDDTYLLPVSSWDEPCVKVGCIALYAGKIRLIDNVIFDM